MAAYVSIDGEPGTGPLLDALRAAGKRVILPVLLPDDDLDWAAYDGPRRPGAGRPRAARARPASGSGRTRSPPPTSCWSPASRSSPTGVRLGRGGGSYDRALGRVPVGTFTCVLLYDDEVGVAGAGRAARPAGGLRGDAAGVVRLGSWLRAALVRIIGTRPGRVPAGPEPARRTVPTYQYACTECGHAFEQVQSFSDDALTECPECQGRLRKVFNAVGVVFKGSGFYRTDSRARRPRRPTAPPRRPRPKTETKTERRHQDRVEAGAPTASASSTDLLRLTACGEPARGRPHSPSVDGMLRDRLAAALRTGTPRRARPPPAARRGC